MKKLFGITVAVAMGLMVCAFTGCASVGDSEKNPLSIDGTWVFDYDNKELVIDLENSLLKNYDEAYPYEGTELVVEEIDKKSGIVFFKQTIGYEQTDKNPEDSIWTKVEYWYNSNKEIVYSDPNDSNFYHYVNWYRWSETSPYAGTWFAVAYWNLTKDSVRIRFPWKMDGYNNGIKTLEQAIEEYTEENGYFPTYGLARRKPE